MSELKALLFDVDGTLAETEEVHRRAFNQAFADAGLDWEWSTELYEELLTVTGGKERMKFYLDSYRPDFKRPPDLDDMIAALHQDKTRYYTTWVESGEVSLRPGVRRLLKSARDAGLRLGIATTTTPANVTALLEHNLEAGSSGWFEVIAAGGMVPAKKPAPDIYKYALQAMELDPGDCIAFEDTANGLLSARAAGIPTVVTVSYYSRRQQFPGALLEVDQLGEPDESLTVRNPDMADVHMVDVPLLRRLHAGLAEKALATEKV